MKWLITGAEGQLGRSLVTTLNVRDIECQILPLSRTGLDIRDRHQVSTVLGRTKPDVVVNCAAWTQVDLAESHESDVFAVNQQGPEHLAEALSIIGQGVLIHTSTDYVFGGDTPGPHPEDEAIKPIGVYARSKANAELSVRQILPERHLIVRTAWLYSEYGSNFARTIGKKILSGEQLRVVDDQLGQPTYTQDVAARIVDLAAAHVSETVPSGTFHAVNTGSATWWDFSAAIADLMHHDPSSILRISSADLGLPARRPSDSRLLDLEGAKWGLSPMRPWRDALREAFPKLRGSL